MAKRNKPERQGETINCPREIQELKQFVVWKLEKVKGRPKPAKVPYCPGTGKRAKADDPGTWDFYEVAHGAWQHSLTNGHAYSGIGFQFSRPWVGVDIDNCLDPETGVLADWALEIVNRFKSYTEISPSGTGVHIFLKGELPVDGTNKPYHGGRVEIYTHRHYFTLTGNMYGKWNKVAVRETALQWLYALLNPEESREATEHDITADAGSRVSLSDEDIIELLEGSKNYKKLWEGDATKYADDDSPDGNFSRADLALVGALCFYSADEEQVIRLWRASGLYRKKLDRDDYVQRTMVTVLEDQTEYYDPRAIVAGDGFNLSDLGNGHRLVTQNEGELVYCYDTKKWLVWDGARWKIDKGYLVDARVRGVIRTLFTEAEDNGNQKTRAAIQEWAAATEMEKHFLAVPKMARQFVPVDLDQFDKDHWLLNVENGTLDLRTGELRDHRREDFITRMAPVTYDPKAECPLFVAFMNRIFDENEALIKFMQRAFGYALTGSTREQCLFICYGEGSNGKTTLLELFMDMLGDYQTKAVTESLMSTKIGSKGENASPDIAKLHRARYTYASEGDEGARFAEGVLKRLTGTETISARFLYQDNFDFRPEFKLFFCTNHRPAIFGTDNAIWRRIRLVPFNVTIPPEEQDHRLPDKLREETPGILRWAVEGCLEWQETGLMPPEEVLLATNEYREEMDVIGEWLDDECDVGEKYQEKTADLYAAYKMWADNRKERPLSTYAFASKLRDKGFKPCRMEHGGQRGWEGVAVRTYDTGLKAGKHPREGVVH